MLTRWGEYRKRGHGSVGIQAKGSFVVCGTAAVRETMCAGAHTTRNEMVCGASVKKEGLGQSVRGLHREWVLIACDTAAVRSTTGVGISVSSLHHQRQH